MKGTGIYRDAKALEKWLADQGGPAKKCARCSLSCKQPKKVVVVACDRYKKAVKSDEGCGVCGEPREGL